MRYDDYDDDGGDHWDDDGDKYKFFEWYDGYKKRKDQKASYPLLGIHQDIGIGACQKKRKKKTETCGDKYRPFLCLMTGCKRYLA